MDSFPDKPKLFSHKISTHVNHSVLLKNGVYESTPWLDAVGNVIEGLHKAFLDNRGHILANSRITNAVSELIAPLIASDNSNRREWGLRFSAFLEDVFRTTSENSFKINLQFARLLMNMPVPSRANEHFTHERLKTLELLRQQYTITFEEIGPGYGLVSSGSMS